MDQKIKFKENPFAVRSPEDMTASEVVSLFVDVMTDFPKIASEGHAFLHGPRGSGKSMIFRYLQQDCQMLKHNCSLKELPFFSIYMTVKNTNLTEFGRLEDKHATVVLNEHFMVMYILQKAFQEISILSFPNEKKHLEEIKNFINDFLKLLNACGFNNKEQTPEFPSCSQYFEWLNKITEQLYKDFLGYVKRLSFVDNIPPYSGPLCDYLDFLLPLLERFKKLSFMPSGPICLLIDDGDNFTLTQTKILNSWVASRTSSKISIKISTQLKYKSFRTVAGNLIETPHDYSEVNISTVYTSSYKTKYAKRVTEIVRRRLELAEINVPPHDFFPEHSEQEAKIKIIAEEYNKKWNEGNGRGNKPTDDALRYARPDYMKSLAGSRKSSHTYYYAGFDQIVHLSSGIIRNFLEAASKMYAQTKSKDLNADIKQIEPSIQNDVVRKISDELMFDAFEKLLGEQSDDTRNIQLLTSLSNLIKVLGGIFQKKLFSNDSERRVFSIAFSDEPQNDIKEIVNLGIELGYFQTSSIGNKDGTGRTRLYILDRRLAPHFKLDPTGFAGYLFVTSAKIADAIHKPDSFIRQIEAKGLESVFEEKQLSFLD